VILFTLLALVCRLAIVLHQRAGSEYRLAICNSHLGTCLKAAILHMHFQPLYSRSGRMKLRTCRRPAENKTHRQQREYEMSKKEADFSLFASLLA
jgi:hypothetical protein